MAGPGLIFCFSLLTAQEYRTQTAQYGSIKEYALNHTGDPSILDSFNNPVLSYIMYCVSCNVYIYTYLYINKHMIYDVCILYCSWALVFF